MTFHEPIRCLCCGYRTLEAPSSLGICPVCWWQDDGQDDSDADVVRGSVNGDLSLTQARLNFDQYGAAHPRFRAYVRKASASEAA
jgi:hypothetical protein